MTKWEGCRFFLLSTGKLKTCLNEQKIAPFSKSPVLVLRDGQVGVRFIMVLPGFERQIDQARFLG